MNKIKELKDRIYKHNPELKKLSFGCKFKEIKFKMKIEGEAEVLSEREYTIFDTNYTFDGERFHTDGVVVAHNKDETYPKLEDRSFGTCSLKDHDNIRYEILGKQIELQHILRASFKSKNSLNISQLGELFSIEEGERVYGHIYNLSKSFDQNITDNPKLLDFLLEVIK